jgi:hypothetical protein
LCGSGKYERNTINVNFQPIKREIFLIVKKHYFWNFSSPASMEFFLANSNHAISLKTKKIKNSKFWDRKF